MKQRQTYATRLTKEDLLKAGISLVTEDGQVFKGDQQLIPSINSAGYWVFPIYVLDEEGNKIKQPIKRQFKGRKKVSDTYVYKVRTLGLHRIMWAWHFSEIPSGYVVDHISNKHDSLEDYRLENLQLLTPAENLNKERGESTKQMKCSLKKPLSWYEDRLTTYLEQYEEAKKNHEANEAHRLRTNIANLKAKIRYYIAHKEEAEKIQMDRDSRINKLRELEEIVIAKRMQYWEAKLEYGEDHFVTECYKAEWHAACRERDNYLKFSE